MVPCCCLHLQEHQKELESALKAVIQRSKNEAMAAAKEIGELQRQLGMDPGTGKEMIHLMFSPGKEIPAALSEIEDALGS